MYSLIYMGDHILEKNNNLSILTKLNLNGIEKVLGKEEIIDAIHGTINRNLNGVKQKEESSALVLTPTRIILYHMKKIGHSSIDLYFKAISSVELNFHILYSDIKIHSGEDVIILEKISKFHGERFVTNLKTLISKTSNTNITVQNSQTTQRSQTS